MTTRWPVLHYGNVPRGDVTKWTFMVSGLVDRPFGLSYDELLALPRKTVVCDIHCVTTWSRLDNDPWQEERYGGRGLTQHEINRFRNASKKLAG
ncbi:MAG: molybdopterin-dependent oxidoreductase [Gemmatimonadales bacterium]